jgi:hypothetical protein
VFRCTALVIVKAGAKYKMTLCRRTAHAMLA